MVSGYEAKTTWEGGHGLPHTRLLPAELKSLGNDVSLKLGSALILTTFIVSLGSVPLRMQFPLPENSPSLFYSTVIHPLTHFVISCLKPSSVPLGCLSHFLFCAPLALCRALTALSLLVYGSSLSRQ